MIGKREQVIAAQTPEEYRLSARCISFSRKLSGELLDTFLIVSLFTS